MNVTIHFSYVIVTYSFCSAARSYSSNQTGKLCLKTSLNYFSNFCFLILKMSTNFSWRYIPYYIFKCVAHHSVLLNNFCIWMLLTLHVLFCQSYIVYLGSHSFGPNPSSIDVESVTMSHYDILESYVGRYIEFNPKFMKFSDVKTNIFLCLWFFFFMLMVVKSI